MMKSHLLDILLAPTLFAMISGANAAIIASDEASITGMDLSHAQTLAVSPLSFPDCALTINILRDSGQTQSGVNSNFFLDDTSSESENHHTDSHTTFWLLLIAAAIAGILSEIFDRRSCQSIM